MSSKYSTSHTFYDDKLQNLSQKIRKNEEQTLFELINKVKKIKASSPLTELENISLACIAHITRIRLHIQPGNPLSVKEMLCLALLAMGKSSAQCADLLGISSKYVRVIEQRIRDKLGAINRTHAFYLAQDLACISKIANQSRGY